MDVNPATKEALYQAMRGNHSLSISGGSLGERNNRCPFSEKGALALFLDGSKLYFRLYQLLLRLS